MNPLPSNPYPKVKAQVEIAHLIAAARHNFFKLDRRWPTALYIGHEDYYNLRREAEPYLFDIEHKTYMGMEIFEVDRDHHLKVA